MRICENCGQTFEGDEEVCPDDQTPLLEPDDELIGQTVERYVLVKKLGKGAMGVIYLGVHPMIRSRVAVKVLHGATDDSHADFSRFVIEARAVNEIKHPNIVRIMDLDALPDGRPFIVMEYLEGVSLRKRMVRPPLLEPDEANHIVIQVLNALGAAHDAGFIHRDLKPDNVFITNDGDVKLLDFGIAKLLDESAKTFATQDGAVVGTPMYLAPEQALGEHDLVGPWTDLYSMGVILYEMYTGKSPFDSKNVSQILLAHINKAPIPPSERNALISAELERTILWCLEKKQADRPQSAQELHEAFDAASDEYAGGLAQTLPGGTLPKLASSSGGDHGSDRASDHESDQGSGEGVRRGSGGGAGSPVRSSPGANSSARGQVTGPFRRGGRPTGASRAVSSGRPGQAQPEVSRSGGRIRVIATTGVIILLGAVIALLLWSRYSGGDKSPATLPGIRRSVDSSRQRSRRKPRGKLVVMQPFQADHLAPHLVTNAEGIDIVRQTHEPLIRYEDLTGQFHPCLATKWSLEGAVYRFRIRRGVRFHDSTLLTPQVVVASLKRSQRSKIGRSYLSDVQDVNIAQSGEVVIRLARPSGSFLLRLSLYPAYIGRLGGRLPVGTGPYKVTAWNRAVGAVVLGPHSGYWGKPARLKSIVFKAEPDAQARASLLIQGNAHIASSLPTHVATPLGNRRDMDLIRSAQSFVSYLKFNTSKPYLSSARLRQALSLAVDRDRLVRDLYGGSATKAISSVPPSLIRPLPDAVKVKYNPKRARALLRNTPLANRTLTLYMYADARPYLPQPKLAARILVEGFAAAGIKVVAKLLPYSDAKRDCTAGHHDLAFFGWGLDYPDAENIYYLISSKGMASGWNYSHFDDPEYNRLLTAAMRELSHDKRLALFRRLERIIENKRPWLPLVYIATSVAKRTKVKGVSFQMSGGEINLTKAYLAR